jgi:predicted transcriptional regulator
MTDIILSIHPKWAEKIYSGEKTVEVRKTRPFQWCSFPSKLIYLYETSPIKKITGFAHLKGAWASIYLSSGSCLSQEELIKYSNGKDLYFWELKDPFKFDTLQDIKGSVPQSWRYLKEGEIYD